MHWWFEGQRLCYFLLKLVGQSHSFLFLGFCIWGNDPPTWTFWCGTCYITITCQPTDLTVWYVWTCMGVLGLSHIHIWIIVSLSRDIIRVLAYTAPVPRCRQKKKKSIKIRTKVTVHFSPWWQSVEEPTTKQGLPCAAFTGGYWCTYSTAQLQLFVLLRKAVGQGPAGEDGKPWTFHSLWWTTAVMTVFMLHKGQKARAANQKTGGWKGLNDELCTLAADIKLTLVTCYFMEQNQKLWTVRSSDRREKSTVWEFGIWTKEKEKGSWVAGWEWVPSNPLISPESEPT